MGCQVPAAPIVYQRPRCGCGPLRSFLFLSASYRSWPAFFRASKRSGPAGSRRVVESCLSHVPLFIGCILLVFGHACLGAAAMVVGLERSFKSNHAGEISGNKKGPPGTKQAAINVASWNKSQPESITNSHREVPTWLSSVMRAPAALPRPKRSAR
jgi:hypothetical protein